MKYLYVNISDATLRLNYYLYRSKKKKKKNNCIYIHDIQKVWDQTYTTYC